MSLAPGSSKSFHDGKNDSKWESVLITAYTVHKSACTYMYMYQGRIQDFVLGGRNAAGEGGCLMGFQCY